MTANPAEKKGVFSFSNCLTALAASLVLLLSSYLPMMDTIERRFLDFAFLLRGAETPHRDIVIIDISDESLRRFGSWPWVRSFHANLLKALDAFKPSVVFFDMIFSESSIPENDTLFASEIKRADNVILAYYFSLLGPKTLSPTPEGMPIDLFKESASGLGYTNLLPDRDGYAREMQLRHTNGKEDFYHASLAMVAFRDHFNQDKLRSFDAQKGTLINYPGPYENFQVVPFEAVIKSLIDPKLKKRLRFLKDKLVLVGHTASGTAIDLKPTAFSPSYPGVGLLASTVHTILTEKYIHKLPGIYYWILLLLVAYITLLITETSNPMKGFLYVLAVLFIVFGIRQLFFQYACIWMPFFGFLVLSPSLFVTITLIRFLKMTIATEVLAKELALASRIQNNFLPSQIPKIEGLEIATASIPARHVGGDLYDLVSVQQTEKHQWGICIGDVSGKGVPAALFMAKSISEFRREASSGNPASVMDRVNKKIAEGGFSGLFLTLLYLMIDPATRHFTFASGGHEPIFFYRKKTNDVVLLKTDLGGPLGIDPESIFDEKAHQADQGDVLVLISDGIKEAMNPRREIFGNERIQSAMLESSSLSSQSMIDHILKRIKEFVKDAPQHDDMTMVCLKLS